MLISFCIARRLSKTCCSYAVFLFQEKTVMPMLVQVALRDYFYEDSGTAFVVELPGSSLDFTLEQLGLHAASVKNASDKFKKFEVFYQNRFHPRLSLLEDVYHTFHDILYIHSVTGDLPLAVYFRKNPLNIYSRFKDGFYPVYPKLTVKQMKHFIDGNASAVWGFDRLNFFTKDGLLTANAKTGKDGFE